MSDSTKTLLYAVLAMGLLGGLTWGLIALTRPADRDCQSEGLVSYRVYKGYVCMDPKTHLLYGR